MADREGADPLERLPEAEVEPRNRGLHLSIVWLLPLVAALIGAWVVYTDYAARGPLITVRFDDAGGIEPKKTRVKYRDVDVGVVEALEFSSDLAHVLVNLRLDKAFDDRIVESTRFWVVRPRVEGLRISGLETLISGAYISMDLGEGGAEKRHFIGLEEPRSILSDVAGTFYRLRAPGLGSLTQGSPVYFRQIAVGEVVAYRLVEEHTYVEIDIFVRAPHDAYVRRNTRFWNVSGVELNLGAEGLRVGVESLASLLAGGVAFQTPQELGPGPRAEAGALFVLHGSADESREAPITITQPYRLYFEDTVRGLSVGAPVEFRGLRIGTVTDIAFEGRADGGPVRTPVTIAVEPERVPLAEPTDEVDFQQLDDEEKRRRIRLLIDRSVKAGLRAQLQTGNLLTGQLFVALDFVPDAGPADVIEDGGPPVLPTVPSTFRGITQSLTRVLGKLEQLPLEEIGGHLAATLAGAEGLVNGGELRHTLGHLESSAQSLSRVLATAEAEAAPLMQTLGRVGQDGRELIAATDRAVRRAESTLQVIEHSLGQDGPMGSEILRTLEELSAASRSIRIMAEYLERHPEALIQGKPAY
jgi:paraquat-inducible protein B